MSRWLCSCLGLKKKEPVVDYWDCSHLNLSELPREVYQHRQTLQTLYMSGNSMKDVPKGIFTLESLTELDLSENDILFLSPAISRLETLTTLNISKNSFSSIPDEIHQCQELIHLNCSSNPLGRLCDGITELRQLRTLIANDCSLEELPPNIGRLSKLETLEVRENIIRVLPQSMCNMTLLEKLDLGVNDFQTLSSVIGTLESLSELWLDTNTLTSLPDEIGNLSHLRFLELSENQLMMLPLTIGGLTNLTDLYLQENMLTFLPETIGQLQALSVLRLDNNRLTNLPDTIDGWVNLMELCVAHNHLPDLPAAVEGLKKLINLNADENMLSELPPEIGSCARLRLLSLRDNELTELPSEIEQLERLSILNVAGNRLNHLPYSLLHLKNMTAVWIAENQSRPIIDLQLIRDEQGEKQLTCYLLPQQDHDEEVSSEGEREKVKVKPELFKRISVAFDPQVKEKKNKITRDPTPYPKELHTKAMQWRASRDIVNGSPTHQSGDVVQLRAPTRRVSYRPYSLLKALSDPLNEDDLLPVSGNRPISPDPIPEDPPHVIQNNHTAVRDDVVQSPVSSSPSPPLLLPPESSYPTTPEGTPCISPPEEFSEVAPVKIQQNGVFFQPQGRDGSVSVSIDGDQVALLAVNSNSNNNNNNNNNNSEEVYLNTHPRLLPMSTNAIYYPSETSTVSQSDNPDVRYSSLESGFDADNELDNTWYLSPNASPKSRTNNNRPSSASAQKQAKVTRPRTRSMGDDDDKDYDHLPRHKVPAAKGPYSITVPWTSHSRAEHGGHTKATRSFDAADVLSTAHHPPISPLPPSSQKHTSFIMARKNSHTRFHSQPQELAHLISPPHNKNVRFRNFSEKQSPLHQANHSVSSHHFLQRRPEHVMSEETITGSYSSYPGHRYAKERSRRVSADAVPREKPRKHRREKYYTSDESQPSGRATPEVPAVKSSWVSGNDSGFDSMKRPKHHLSEKRGSTDGTLSHSGALIEVDLVKNPTLGLGITGGRDGENAIIPGDPGYNVYKVVEGMPAHECGQIAIGDKLLEVNGTNVAELNIHDVLALLTGPDKHISLVLYREPSVTLL